LEGEGVHSDLTPFAGDGVAEERFFLGVFLLVGVIGRVLGLEIRGGVGDDGMSGLISDISAGDDIAM
jgi:hypothetical protein